jgi:hypothetical protein
MKEIRMVNGSEKEAISSALTADGTSFKVTWKSE